jgi:hypothetical protein
MGYTHYFTFKSSPSAKELRPLRQSFEADLKMLFTHLPKYSTSAGSYFKEHILRLYNADGKKIIADPEKLIVSGDKEVDGFDGEAIIFNGSEFGSLDHEPFIFWLDFSFSGDGFNFCKTARKPYDWMVCATLLLVHDYFSEFVEVSSDGDLDDWLPVITWASNILSRSLSIPKAIGDYVAHPSPDYVSDEPYQAHKVIDIASIDVGSRSSYF